MKLAYCVSYSASVNLANGRDICTVCWHLPLNSLHPLASSSITLSKFCSELNRSNKFFQFSPIHMKRQFCYSHIRELHCIHPRIFKTASIIIGPIIQSPLLLITPNLTTVNHYRPTPKCSDKSTLTNPNSIYLC